jgi:hypothetical protein
MKTTVNHEILHARGRGQFLPQDSSIGVDFKVKKYSSSLNGETNNAAVIVKQKLAISSWFG